MFFIKKAVIFFINPLVLFIIALGVSFYLWKKKGQKDKAYKIALLSSVFLLLLSFPPISHLIARPLEMQYAPSSDHDDAEFIAVLGSGHSSESTWPNTIKLSRTARSRLMEGLRQAQLNPQAKFIFFGFGINGKEAHGEIMSQAAAELGVDPENIIFSIEPRDTNEEALFAKEVCGDQKMLLVTDATHTPRAMTLFKSHGLNVFACPANYESYGGAWFVPMPSAEALELSRKSIYEYVGLIWVKLRTK
ncbi:ElyC/SanA/YdcF family protein [Lentisphaera profundi]|uniref:ElyC/SanA/YdcF family protein n=1 Tax=Lentisphaera profundi TaxID=1658616 RepID=A0ABY7VXU1_9BACT|nr:ElyC/SanA/YdcF family protein [Lentisphaera profundi]WDE99081.1 ElyC/SanA/YdcF family protein [Lentisphaera profundi]